jgi:transcriptional regulator with XRE-family HTH domain
MEESTEQLSTVIGTRVKKERQLHRWTLDQLADAAGVSRRILVSIEQGAANPSIGTLLRIADALGVGFPSLIEPPRVTSMKLTRHGEGAVLWRGDHGGRGVLVAATEPPNIVELWDWTLGLEDLHVSEPHTTGTRELVQVLEGTLIIVAGDNAVTLADGDALSFPGDVAHSYVNAGPQAARFSLTVFDPGTGATSRQDRTNG